LPVLGSSMTPLLRTGDQVALEHSGEDPAVGDVVVFWTPGGIVVHRVVASTTYDGMPHLVTKGDALCTCDPPITTAQVLGRVGTIYSGERRLSLLAPQARRWGARIAHYSYAQAYLWSWLQQKNRCVAGIHSGMLLRLVRRTCRIVLVLPIRLMVHLWLAYPDRLRNEE
ncbi:MAG TPA: S24/S26 family peptidase, partial [Armatimonadota bacterium]|nr:S24/S26 family peptidase [Armatimonadota bacterium]